MALERIFWAHGQPYKHEDSTPLNTVTSLIDPFTIVIPISAITTERSADVLAIEEVCNGRGFSPSSLEVNAFSLSQCRRVGDFYVFSAQYIHIPKKRI